MANVLTSWHDCILLIHSVHIIFVANDTSHNVICTTKQLVVRARENSMSPGGISSVVLGYSRLDGGAARVGAAKSVCALIS